MIDREKIRGDIDREEYNAGSKNITNKYISKNGTPIIPMYERE